MRRTFRVRSPWRPLVPLVLFGGIAVAILLALTPAEDWFIVAIVAAVLLLSGTIGLWLMTRTRLEVGPERVTYHAIGYRVSGSWADVTGWDRRVLGANDYDSLILRGSGLEMSGWMAFLYRLMPAASVAAFLGGGVVPSSSLEGQKDAIPVGLFDKDWRAGEIGALVRQYAPQAFANDLGRA
ncbi:MAG: hypothetical protein U0667_16645 [Chloroflexota bacterium]